MPEPTDPLDGWPETATGVPPLDDAPFLLPTTDIAAQSVELTTADRSGAQVPPVAFVQEFALGDGRGLATLETTIGASSPSTPGATSIEVNGWSSATLTESSIGAMVTLSDTRGFTRIVVRTSSEPGRVAAAIAGALSRRDPTEPGWMLSKESPEPGAELVAGSVLLIEGWASGWNQRLSTWVDPDGGASVQVIVSVGQPYLLGWTGVVGVPELLDGFGDGRAVGIVIEGRGSLVAWSLGGGATATVMTRGPVSDTADLARDLAHVDQPTWEAAGLLLPPRVEFGCDYFLNSC